MPHVLQYPMVLLFLTVSKIEITYSGDFIIYYLPNIHIPICNFGIRIGYVIIACGKYLFHRVRETIV